MRLTLLTWGTRGDIQPYVALGTGLQAAGHTVRLAAPALFKDMVIEHGLEFFPLAGDPRQMIANETTNTRLETRNPLQAMRHITQLFAPLIEPMLDDGLKACAGADAIIYGPFVWAGAHIAEALDVPCMLAVLCPLYPTSAFPNPMTVPNSSLGGLLNRSTHTMSLKWTWFPYQREINRLRHSRLGLRPLRFAGSMYGACEKRLPQLMGYSAHVMPKPSDWPEWVHVTGYWFLPPAPAWRPPAKLVAFLEDGPPPLYIGFGSMHSANAEHDTTVVLKSLAALKQRAILTSGWGGLRPSDLSDQVFMVDAVPHDWLFPQMRALVHHGGGGTVGAGLCAGVPSVIVPFLAEQPFWGHRLHTLGVSPPVIPHQQLSVGALTAALKKVIHDERMQQRVAALGEQIRAEDGIHSATTIIEEQAQQRLTARF
ncbi:MAG: glycosyltransferase family 1 protein [Herpetosiphonaceae bacterium]|nr:glycosyltransferase family 1 protein [Herpetosiphonaceae bacterium]